MRIQTLLHRLMCLLWTIVAGFLVWQQFRDGNYVSVAIIAGGGLCLIGGHWNERRWAAQASAFLVVMFNILAVFLCFPPFEDRSSVSIGGRIIGFVVISIACVLVAVGMFWIQRKTNYQKPMQ
jgi:hypothetical protein